MKRFRKLFSAVADPLVAFWLLGGFFMSNHLQVYAVAWMGILFFGPLLPQPL